MFNLGKLGSASERCSIFFLKPCTAARCLGFQLRNRPHPSRQRPTDGVFSWSSNCIDSLTGQLPCSREDTRKQLLPAAVKIPQDKRRNTVSLAAHQEISVDAAVEICCNSIFSLREEQRGALKALISGRHGCALLLTGEP